MAEQVKMSKRLKDIVEESQYWKAEDLLRNVDEEMRRLELGFGHIILDFNDHIVSKCLRPLPSVPRFQASEDADEFSLRVLLPNVSTENVHVDIDKRSVEIFACSDDAICKPYYVNVECKGTLDPETADARRDGNWVEIKVKKSKRKKVEIR